MLAPACVCSVDSKIEQKTCAFIFYSYCHLFLLGDCCLAQPGKNSYRFFFFPVLIMLDFLQSHLYFLLNTESQKLRLTGTSGAHLVHLSVQAGPPEARNTCGWLLIPPRMVQVLRHPQSKKVLVYLDI